MKEPENRRKFLQLAAAAGGCALCGTSAGCAKDNGPELLNDVVIQLSDYPALLNEGGAATIPRSVSDYSFEIFVTNEGSGVYRALSAWCSHEACGVTRNGSGYRCPCHGATFDSQGDRTGGPAPRGLIQFSTESTAATLTILSNV